MGPAKAVLVTWRGSIGWAARHKRGVGVGELASLRREGWQIQELSVSAHSPWPRLPTYSAPPAFAHITHTSFDITHKGDCMGRSATWTSHGTMCTHSEKHE